MKPIKRNEPCQDLLLTMRRQIDDANLKLDHIIYQLQDDYYRQFYKLYGKELEG